MRMPILYFAYGSNMNPARMARRCPGAKCIGVGELEHYKLKERLYADIDYEPGAKVYGVFYLLTEQDLRKLDSFEGYPKVYRRFWLEASIGTEKYLVVTYEMTPETKRVREGKPYPEDYRKLCSDGARHYHIKNQFTKRRRKA